MANPYLSNGFEPVRFETDATCEIEGSIPAGLEGTFYRIGPNPEFEPLEPYNPLNGDGMVHAFRIASGGVSYRNRWIRTKQWQLSHEAGRSLFATSGNPSGHDPLVRGVATDGVANTNLVWHGGKLLAMEEGFAPFAIDPVTLETHGPWNFGGRLPRNMTAHPKIDALTGEMLTFANFPQWRANGDIGFYIASAAGEITHATTVRGPLPALIHDFAVARDFVAFANCPVTVSLKRAQAGGPLLAWEPGLGTHVGILRRADGEVRWFEGSPSMAWHVVNAFNEGDRITVDVCEQAAAMFPFADGAPPDAANASQYLTRWSFDWDGPRRFSAQRLSEVRCEYPRIDERQAMDTYRYAFVACDGGPGSGDLFHRGIGRFDHESGAMEVFAAGKTAAVAEPVFIAAQGAAREGEGWVLTNIFDEARNASHLAIFDAHAVAAGPIARAHVKHRVPVGFHAFWKPGF